MPDLRVRSPYSAENKLYQRTGTIPCNSDPEVHVLRPDPAQIRVPRYGVLICWPAAYTWLRLLVAVDDRGTASRFSDKEQDLTQLLKDHNTHEAPFGRRVNDERWKASNQFQAGTA